MIKNSELSYEKTETSDIQTQLKQREFGSCEFDLSLIMKGQTGKFRMKLLSVDEVDNSLKKAQERIKKIGLDSDDVACERVRIAYLHYYSTKIQKRPDGPWYPLFEEPEHIFKQLTPDELTVLDNCYSIVMHQFTPQEEATDQKSLAQMIVSIRALEGTSIWEKAFLTKYTFGSMINIVDAIAHLVPEAVIDELLKEEESSSL